MEEPAQTPDSLIQRISDSDELINAAYDLALDPKQFHEFAESWLAFSESLSLASVGDDQHRLQRAMARHFERAFLLMEKMGRRQDNADPAHEQVEQRANPAFEVDDVGRVLCINSAAKSAFEELREREGKEYALWQIFHDKSRPSLNIAVKDFSESRSVEPILVLQKNGTPCLLLLKSVLETNSTIVEVVQPTWSHSTDLVLSNSYQLTNRECEVTALLYRGLSARRIAEISGKSHDTVRTQIRSVLKKMSCDTQAHLMRLLTSIVFFGAQQSKTNWFINGADTQFLSINDGRQIEFYDMGNPTGPAILVFHGIMHTPELPTNVMQSLVDEGYRLVGFCRAGYGNSSAPKSWDDLLQSSTADVDILLNHLDIDVVSLLALMGGSAFAYSFATYFPERVNRVIAVGGVVPSMDEEHVQNLPASAVALIRAARWFPKLVILLVRSAVALVDQGDTEKIAQLAYRDGSVDYLTAISKEQKAVLAHAYRFTSHQGHKAYANSGVAVIKEHLDLVAGLSCSVILIHGKNDEIQPIDNVRSFADMFTHVSLCEIPDAGQLAMLSQPKLVIKRLLEALTTA